MVRVAAAPSGGGHILGWSALSQDGTSNVGPQRGVLWRDGMVYELASVIDPVTGAGWTISTANGINNQGQIVGLGIHNGQNRAFLLTPITAASAAAQASVSQQ